MKTLNKRILLLLALLAVVLSCGFFTKNVSAATKTGFVTMNGKTYYVNEDGSKAKGWMQLGKYKYYFITFRNTLQVKKGIFRVPSRNIQ